LLKPLQSVALLFASIVMVIDWFTLKVEGEIVTCEKTSIGAKKSNMCNNFFIDRFIMVLNAMNRIHIKNRFIA